MGYGGKWRERERARELRAQSWTLQEIARELGVAKASVSVWVRDVEFVAKPRNRGHPSQQLHPLHLKKLHEIERCRTEGIERIGVLSEREFLIAGLALYAGEGAKTDGCVSMANSDPRLLVFFVRWLRHCFDIDDRRLRVHLYLHEGLDLGAAMDHWSELLAIPTSQFIKPYRAVVDPSRRRAKHVFGCPSVTYSCATTHRRVMGMLSALSSDGAIPG